MIEFTERIGAEPKIFPGVGMTVVEDKPKKKDDDNERMDVAAAQKYIPGHPAIQTIYGWTFYFFLY